MKKLSTILIALFAIFALSGCMRSTEGNFFVVKNWDKTYQDAPSYGLEWVIFDSAQEVYGRERLLQVLDARPKDKENVMLQDLDLSVSYRINPNKAIDFLRARGDITSPRDMPNGVYVVGETYVHKDAKSVIGETIKKFYSEEILNEKRRVEEQFKEDLQNELDTLYGSDTFYVTEVKIANIVVAPSIEDRIQSVALINAEKIKAEAISKVLDTRLEIQTKEMMVIAQTAENSGLSVDQVLEARRLDILREMPAGAVQVMVSADKSE